MLRTKFTKDEENLAFYKLWDLMHSRSCCFSVLSDVDSGMDCFVLWHSDSDMDMVGLLLEEFSECLLNDDYEMAGG